MKNALAARFGRALGNANGMSLVESLVVVAILGIASYNIAGMIAMMTKAQVNLALRETLADLRENIRVQLKDDLAWSYTIADSANAQTGCLRAAPFQCNGVIGFGGGWLLQRIYNRQNVVAYSVGNSAGFDRTGAACTGFPSDTCVIGVDIKWRPIAGPGTGCLPVSCIAPMVEIEAVFQVDISVLKQYPLNVARYNFKLTRAGADAQARSCELAGGTFNYATRLCNVPPTQCTDYGGTWMGGGCDFPSSGGRCPPGSIMAGQTTDGGIICQPVSLALKASPDTVGLVLGGFVKTCCESNCGISIVERVWGAGTSGGTCTMGVSTPVLQVQDLRAPGEWGYSQCVGHTVHSDHFICAK